MKPILLLAAAAFGAAGLITMAAPASAESCEQAPATFVNGIATEAHHFQTNLQSQRSQFEDSIDAFLNKGGTDSHGTTVPGVTKQVQFFVADVTSKVDDVRSRLSGLVPDSK